jgi:NAD(P)-dependent dehydrogenase (short-subunit alcohol dehydrogenase family)
MVLVSETGFRNQECVENTMEIKGKTVIITGAGSGVGRAAAIEFSKAGAQVIACGRRKEKLKETVRLVKSDKGEAIAVPTDVTHPAQIEALVKKALSVYGRIDVLFNNAASFHALGAVWEVDPDLWWQDLNNNLRGPFFCCRAVLPHMIERGSGAIINLTAQAGTDAKPGCSGYACSKAGLIHLTNTLAAELTMKHAPVLVFGLDPGFNRTEMTEELAAHPESAFWLPRVQQNLDTDKATHPEQVARTALELILYGKPVLAGRTFRVGVDIGQIDQKAAEIEEKDLLTLRFRHLR